MSKIEGLRIDINIILGLSLLMNEGIAYRCEGHIQRIPGGQPRCYGNSVLIQDVCIPGQNFLQFNNMKWVYKIHFGL